MKAARFYPPGGPEKIRIKDEPIPQDLKENEVLIKVHAVGLIWTELYWPIYQSPGGDYIPHIPGHDFSGVVIKVGSGVENPNIQPGCEVCAFTSRRNHEGAMAECAVSDMDQVMPKPKTVDLNQAAALPLSALTAWQALYDHGNLQKGQRLLITGAAGGTGVFAVPFARLTGAHVIGTGSSPKSREILDGLGIDQFVDYKTQDLKSAVGEVDLVLDCVGGKTFEDALGIVKKDGMIVSINEVDAEKIANEKGIRCKFFIVKMNTEQFSTISELIDAGNIKIIVDEVFPLDNVQEAFQHAARGHVHGKTIIKVTH